MMPNPFSVHRTMQSGITVMCLDGFLDAHTAPAFEKAVQEEIEAGRVSIVADCAKLSYISSAGLGVFMGFIEEIREKGGDIKICGLIPKVRGIFEVLGFPAIFDITEAADEALKLFADGSTRRA